MTGPSARHRVVELSTPRRLMISMLDLPRPRHLMYALLEVDVTRARRAIEGHRERTGETLSFTGYLTHCLARAVAENPAVHAYIKGRRRLVQFDDVDVGLMVERATGTGHALTGVVVRGANRKSWPDIHREIRAAQSAPVTADHGMPRWLRRGLLLPWPFATLFRHLLGAVTRYDPTLFTALSGTVGVTAVGMFGAGLRGWGLSVPEHSLSLIVGSVGTRPAVVDGSVEPRDMLNLTVAFDHQVVDGAPATRFTRRLVELIEAGPRDDAA